MISYVIIQSNAYHHHSIAAINHTTRRAPLQNRTIKKSITINRLCAFNCAPCAFLARSEIYFCRLAVLRQSSLAIHITHLHCLQFVITHTGLNSSRFCNISVFFFFLPLATTKIDARRRQTVGDRRCTHFERHRCIGRQMSYSSSNRRKNNTVKNRCAQLHSIILAATTIPKNITWTMAMQKCVHILFT